MKVLKYRDAVMRRRLMFLEGLGHGFVQKSLMTVQDPG